MISVGTLAEEVGFRTGDLALEPVYSAGRRRGTTTAAMTSTMWMSKVRRWANGRQLWQRLAVITS